MGHVIRVPKSGKLTRAEFDSAKHSEATLKNNEPVTLSVIMSPP